ncbi:MAG TPA: hypothetical protein VFJ84_02150 [Candidatus Saccharimonadales bacterium]|nr:hypothetical protein [Candidatus Saccharimonadales bacterium]
MDPAAAKQQIAERVKQAGNFLVTVNANPTVDQLAACIGLTLLLNKMGKHATAVFSGKVPNVLEFLEPQKTLQKNTDALRDFIISLDKNKADKLRYKVEDDVVKIFITPYRTSITARDLVFSEGDFNVEVVLALGVTQRGQLDKAITAHGRILHDATVISLNWGAAKPGDVGQINWTEPTASSLSEMLVSISEALGPGLIDQQIATAFLTGIVSETQRFSNKKTSPKVMTMSAQLMAAGANQQLIISKLEPPEPPAEPPKTPNKKPPPPRPKPEGIMDVPHHEDAQPEESIDLGTTEIRIDEQGNLKSGLAEMAAPAPMPQEAPSPPPETHLPLPPISPAMPALDHDSSSPIQTEPYKAPVAAPPKPIDPQLNHHAFMSQAPPAGAAPEGEEAWTGSSLDPADPYGMPGAPLGQGQPPADEVFHTKDIQPPADVSVVPDSLDQARGAVQSALAAAPYDPLAEGPIQALNAQPLQPAPDVHTLNLPADPSAAQPPENSPSDSVAPPPVPPPLMATPGSVPLAPPPRQ